MISRRKFIAQSLATVAAGSALTHLSSCDVKKIINGSTNGPNAALGHRLRNLTDQRPRKQIKKDVVIVGGGIAGLSAARILKKNNTDFTLLELEQHVGGNSSFRRNALSAYPLGAHYLPLPNLDNHALLDFLQEVGVITHYEKGLPQFNEHYLCFDPKERLYINEHWQEGLIPQDGVPSTDQQQIVRFLEQMERWRNQLGRDQKYAFNIPVAESSSDPEILALDQISMDAWLKGNQFTSTYLNWYVNYCCLDDFGSSTQHTSAWAGLHYFASRKGGKGFHLNHDAVLTWPEGNGWLMNRLREPVAAHIQSQCLVTKVQIQNQKVSVVYFNELENHFEEIIAGKVIMATHQFINRYLLGDAARTDYSAFEYAPWMVANLTVNADLHEKRGEPLAWDNVVYGSNSLGYVNAMHQHLASASPKKVITYYKPLSEYPYTASRKQLQKQTWENWLPLILEDLKRPHPQLKELLEEVAVWHWGHGMISPQPGFITSDARRMAQRPIADKIFFAHSDLSGISIFEEAFYWGTKVAKEMVSAS